MSTATRTWRELTDEIALAVWIIEAADMFCPPDVAERRWRELPADRGPKVAITRYVGSALIALKERGLVDYGEAK